MGSFYLEIQLADLEDLITGAKSNTSNDSPEMNEIIRRFDDHAKAVAFKITRDCHLREDLANAARMGVVMAVRNHTVGQAGFPSYARAYMIGAAKRELGHWTRSGLPEEIHQVGLDEEIDADALFRIHDDLPPTADRTWGTAHTSKAIATVKTEQQELLHLRFIEDMTMGDIADTAGITESAISQRLVTVLKAVRHSMAAEG